MSYPLQQREVVDVSHQPEEGLSPLGANPFPGLRPFTIEESHLFFGREGHVDELLVKLALHRSVTIMGYSGSGKSSLVYCGLVPVLFGGFMTETSPNWQVVTSRPGNSPIHNLAEAIVAMLESTGRISKDDRQIQLAVIKSVLRGSAQGLIEISRYLQMETGENIFFLVDQFEELLRFREQGEEEANEAALFVSLILQAVHQREYPIYASLSLRSDYIGECSVFPGLTDMINNSNYLVPQMSREQKRLAIEGPVAVGGGKITNRLVKKLLSDLGDHQDQLPIMQHAMMRTWEYWVANREPGEPMDIRHYNAIGRIGQALSLHANEAYDELDSNQKEIAEVLFKHITEKNQENQGIRRPVKIKVVADLVGTSEEEVIRVVDNFRRAGRSFLMPGVHVQLTGASMVELSHESLMRIWTRLSNWVEEEFESAQLYKRISNAAALYQTGKAGLWRPPDLQLALNWQKKQKPTRIWAQRYDVAFERAIVFLDTSRITYEAELKNQEMLQRRMLRRARVTNLVLGVAAIIAILFLIYGYTQTVEANKQRIAAEAGQKKALEAKAEADHQREIAETQRKIAEDGQEQLKANNILLEKALVEARIAKAEAERQYNIALAQERIAIAAQKQEEVARENAVAQTIKAQEARDQANKLLYLSVAQSMEAKSVTMEEPNLAGLLAMQGYVYHTTYGGKKYDPYVFKGLYYAIGKLKNDFNYNMAKVPGDLKNKMFALAVSRKTNSFFTSGNDGRIFEGNYQTLKADRLLDFNPYPNRVLALSIDEKYLVVGSDSSTMQIFHLEKQGEKPGLVKGHKGFVKDIKFLPDNSGFISVSSDHTIRFTNHVTGHGKVVATLSMDIKSIDISPDGQWVAAVSYSGQLLKINLRDNSVETLVDESANKVRLLSVAFHPTQPLLAYGTEFMDKDPRDDRKMTWKGSVKIFNFEKRETVKELTGHSAGVSDIEFSPDGLLLASAGLDKKLQMWVVEHEEDLPVVMDFNTGNIWKLAFSKDSDYLLASCNNGEVRVWQTNPKVLADQICPKLKRNMTEAEWEIYVGNGIGYESTCKSLLISDF